MNIEISSNDSGHLLLAAHEGVRVLAHHLILLLNGKGGCWEESVQPVQRVQSHPGQYPSVH